MIRLSNRLQTVAEFVSDNSIVVDVGTDHGLLPAYLILNGIAKKVIATDISEPSLNKTVLLAKRYDLSDRIACRVGNGLQVIRPFEADTVVIAGMGGVLISEILSESRITCDSISSFILQPMAADSELRNYLFNSGFAIENEKLSFDSGKFYHTMLVSNGLQFTDYKNTFVSPFWEKNDLLSRYLEHSVMKQNIILQGLSKAAELNRIRYEEELKKREAFMNALSLLV